MNGGFRQENYILFSIACLGQISAHLPIFLIFPRREMEIFPLAADFFSVPIFFTDALFGKSVLYYNPFKGLNEREGFLWKYSR